MRKKGKCIFAHGPVELRVKEGRYLPSYPGASMLYIDGSTVMTDSGGYVPMGTMVGSGVDEDVATLLKPRYWDPHDSSTRCSNCGLQGQVLRHRVWDCWELGDGMAGGACLTC